VNNRGTIRQGKTASIPYTKTKSLDTGNKRSGILKRKAGTMGMLRKQIKRTYLPISIASFPELNGKLANYV
jgi:hypothetical protein